jgi:hypothetical protein
MHVWTYNHREGGADVYRKGDDDVMQWVANCANGLVAQAMCTWLDKADPLPLELNPPRLYRKP